MADEIQEETIEAVEVDPHEAEAVKYGWKPADGFQGDGHMSAEAWMTRGPGTSRKAVEANEQLTKQLAETQAGVDARFERMERANKAREDARVADAVAKVTAQKREAAESGDMELYDRLDKQPVPEVETAKTPVEDIPPDIRRAMDAWIPDNSWFNQDRLANADAIAWFGSLQAEGKSPEEALKEITKRTKMKSPWLFPEPEQKRTQSAVDGGGLPVRRSAKKGWGDIPDEDRRLVKSQIDRGEWNDLAKTMKTSAQEAYASQYWGDEA